MGFVEDKIAHLGATIALEGERTREAFAAGQQQTQRGLVVTGARYASLPGDTHARVLSAAGGRLMGWSIKATAGPVLIVFRDGDDTDAPVIAICDLADQESETVWFGRSGVSFGRSLFLDLSGTGTALLGSVLLGAVD